MHVRFELLESSGITENGQKKNYRATSRYGEYKVRITISLDTSYSRTQSSAKAEVWYAPELAWHTVATLRPEEWTESDGRTYHRPGGSAAEDEDIQQCEAALESMIMMALD